MSLYISHYIHMVVKHKCLLCLHVSSQPSDWSFKVLPMHPHDTICHAEGEAKLFQIIKPQHSSDGLVLLAVPSSKPSKQGFCCDRWKVCFVTQLGIRFSSLDAAKDHTHLSSIPILPVSSWCAAAQTLPVSQLLLRGGGEGGGVENILCRGPDWKPRLDPVFLFHPLPFIVSTATTNRACRCILTSAEWMLQEVL